MEKRKIKSYIKNLVLNWNVVLFWWCARQAPSMAGEFGYICKILAYTGTFKKESAGTLIF